MKRLILLVTGGRTFAKDGVERELLFAALRVIEPDVVVHGGASGADTAVDVWARQRGVPCLRWPAQWGEKGMAAGPKRNAEMVDLVAQLSAKNDVMLLRCPGGAGTEDCERRAREKGLRVVELREMAS